MRGSMQQVSWQLQDVAVQSQMGTDKLMILGQQGPQLASVFGPGGAVVGALIAFGSVLAGVVINSLGGTSQELKALEEQTKQNANAFDDLTEAQQGAIRIDTIKKIEAQKKLLKQFTHELETASQRIAVISMEGAGGLDISETAEEFANRLVGIQAKADTANQMIGLYQDSIDDLRTDTEKLIDKLKEQERVTAKTTEQIIKSSEAYKKATPEQQREILLRAQNIETLKREKLAKDEAIAVDKKAAEEKALFIANLDKQHNLMKLTGEDLYIYQANQAGATDTDRDAIVAKIRLNAETKEQIRLAADAAKKKEKADDDAAKVKLKAEQDAKELAKNAAQRGLDSITQLALQHEAERIQLADDLAKELITQQTHDEALKGQARETAAALAEIDKKSAEDKQAITDAKLKIDQQVLASAAGIIGQLAGIAEEGSREARILFAMQKAIAIAQIIVATEVAAQAAAAQAALLGGPVAWYATQGMIRAMGYASAGIVAGTAIAGGRALGGQVRGGESYLVGERGPELLTMGTSGRIATNENLKNAVGGDSGSGVTINQTINVTTGIQSTVRAEIVQLMPQIAQAAKGAVADGRQRGGNFSRAMSGA